MKRTKYFVANNQPLPIYIIAPSGHGNSLFNDSVGLPWQLHEMYQFVPEWSNSFARQITQKQAEKIIGNRKHFRSSVREIIRKNS